MEKSISLIKEYDPVTCYELSGLGNRFDEIKTNYILPFLTAKNQSELNRKISDTYIQETIKGIEQYLLSISKHLEYKTTKRIKKKIKKQKKTDIEETRKELIENYYDLIMTLIPENEEKPTLKEFENELKSPEIKAILEQQIELFTNVDMNQIMNLVAENPYVSVEEARNKLEQKPVGNTV